MGVIKRIMCGNCGGIGIGSIHRDSYMCMRCLGNSLMGNRRYVNCSSTIIKRSHKDLHICRNSEHTPMGKDLQCIV